MANTRLIILSVVLCTIISAAVHACNTYNKNIHLHVYECEKAETEELGDFIIQQTKQRRDMDFVSKNTCAMVTTDFLAQNQRQIASSFAGSEKIAGLWVYQYYMNRHKVFMGPDTTAAAVTEGRTLNVIIDKNVNILSLTLLNRAANVTVQGFYSSLNLPNNAEFKVLSCEHYLHYLAKVAKKSNFSVTLTDYLRSNSEYRFNYLSSGIGGFYSKLLSQSTLHQ